MNTFNLRMIEYSFKWDDLTIPWIKLCKWGNIDFIECMTWKLINYKSHPTITTTHCLIYAPAMCWVWAQIIKSFLYNGLEPHKHKDCLGPSLSLDVWPLTCDHLSSASCGSCSLPCLLSSASVPVLMEVANMTKMLTCAVTMVRITKKFIYLDSQLWRINHWNNNCRPRLPSWDFLQNKVHDAVSMQRIKREKHLLILLQALWQKLQELLLSLIPTRHNILW